MPNSRGLNSTNPAYLESLQARHAGLAEQIEHEQARPSTSPLYLRDLKKKKLFLKEEIVSVQSAGTA
ncbi:MAG: DUF465 domain-containing protein [Rhodospirillales bacterium]|nr:DUF465 domain-containing protein [Rhodospirillales bacterium]